MSANDLPFRLKITGGDARLHRMPAYDGYMSLAGFALTLSLVANYAETGVIRRKGDFPGRRSVKAYPVQSGSILSDFLVRLKSMSSAFGVHEGGESPFFYDLVQRILDRNLGVASDPSTDDLGRLIDRRDGDVEALVAAAEPSIKQAHSIVGEGAQVVSVFGGPHRISEFNPQTKSYVNATITEESIVIKDVSVASFNVNSGYGSVFDFDHSRVVPIRVTKNTLPSARTVLAWGLNQYANNTGKTVSLRFFRELALDGTPKRYIVVDASIPKD